MKAIRDHRPHLMAYTSDVMCPRLAVYRYRLCLHCNFPPNSLVFLVDRVRGRGSTERERGNHPAERPIPPCTLTTHHAEITPQAVEPYSWYAFMGPFPYTVCHGVRAMCLLFI